MNDEIHKLGDEIKKELTKLYLNKAFAPITELIRQRFEAFRKEKIAFHLYFDAQVASSKKPKPFTLTRFSLARISTGVTFPSDVKEDPEEEKSLAKWEQGWSAARYTTSYGEMPSAAKKNIKICEHCNGSGVIKEP